MLNKFRKRSGAVRFNFSMTVHALAPWPAVDRAVAIGWQRGSKKSKRGATASKMPQPLSGRLGSAVEFEEAFQLSATLYMDGGRKPSTAGPFKKKALILAVLETERSGETKSLGRVVIDLAQYAAPLNEVKRDFDIACSKSIQSAVGTPQLSVSLRCTWKGASGPGSAASSHSSDTTGSALTSNLSSFWHKKEKRKQGRLTGEQADDLRGFEHLANRPGLEPDSPQVGAHDGLPESPNPPAIDFPRLNTIRESDREYLRQASRQSLGVTLAETHDESQDGGGRAVPDAIANEYDADGVLRDSDLDSEPNPPANSASGPHPSPPPPDRVSSWLASMDGSEQGVKTPKMTTREQEVKDAAQSLLAALGSSDEETDEGKVAENESAGSGFSGGGSGRRSMESPVAQDDVCTVEPESTKDGQGGDAALEPEPSGQSEPESEHSWQSPVGSLPAQESIGSPASFHSGVDSLPSVQSGSLSGRFGKGRKGRMGPANSPQSTGKPFPLRPSTAETVVSTPGGAECLPSQRATAEPVASGQTSADPITSQQSAPNGLPVRHTESGANPFVDSTSHSPRGEHHGVRSDLPEKGGLQQGHGLPETSGEGTHGEEPRSGSKSLPLHVEPSTSTSQATEQGHAPRRWTRVFDKEGKDHKSPTLGKTEDVEGASRKDNLSIPLRREKGSVATRDYAGLHQLRTAAFLEASVYLARSGRHRDKPRNMHAPARRIARTVAALGPEQGAAAGRNALRAIKAMVDGAGANTCTAAFWWTNCVQLRLLLPNLATKAGAGPPGPKEVHWAVKALAPQVAELEKDIFDRVQQYLWWKVLMSEVVGTAGKGEVATATSCSSTGSPRPEKDVAVHRWLGALAAVDEQFQLCASGKGLEGHVPLLKTQVLRNCMKRMDMILFQEMLADGGEFGAGIVTQAPSETLGTAVIDDTMGGGLEGWPLLEDLVLPFSRGPLTFGVGMNLKMAVTRWSEWAFRVDVGGSHVGGEPSHLFFPLLTATADLLMMPKELLTDKGVREDIFSALSLRSMCCIMKRYQPDDFAPEAVTPAVQEQLDVELRQSKPCPVQLCVSYEAPDASALERLDECLAVDMDSDSEDDLDELDGMYERCGDEGPPRFEVLKDLWGRKAYGAVSARR
eukprot:evm.model.scf_295.7 EVM.evm.TU.scf_295.7   scf_295:72286-82378(+)